MSYLNCWRNWRFSNFLGPVWFWDWFLKCKMSRRDYQLDLHNSVEGKGNIYMARMAFAMGWEWRRAMLNSLQVFNFFALLSCLCVYWINWLTLNLHDLVRKDCLLRTCWMLGRIKVWLSLETLPLHRGICSRILSLEVNQFPFERSLVFKNVFGKLFATNFEKSYAVRIFLLSYVSD